MQGDRIPVVMVVGMHRSGTSLCANMLHAIGIDMADTPSVSPNNLRGHWERPRINDLNDKVLDILNRRWGDTAHALPLPPNWLGDRRVIEVRDALVAWLRPLVAGGRFGFKDPRTARLLPLWRQVFTALLVQPRFVMCVRDPAQVARSVAARDRLAHEHAEYRWLIYNAQAALGIANDDVCIVPYENWFACPERTARRLAAFVGVGAPDATTVRAMVDPALRHDDTTSAPVRKLAQRLHTMIRNSAEAGRFSAELLALCADVDEFEAQVQPLLVDTEILRASVVEQNKVIANLNAALRAARHERV